jgi:hypothetical protein
MAVRPQTACPLPPIPYADWHSFGRTGRTSPIILTNTRFGRPSRHTRSAPMCQRLRRAQSSRRGGRWSPQPPLRVAAHAASGARPHSYQAVQDMGLHEASLAGAVVPPVLGPAASGPAASLVEVRGVMFRALSRVSTLFIIYRSHTPDGRDHCDHGPRPEQPLNPVSTIALVLRTRFGMLQDQEKN